MNKKYFAPEAGIIGIGTGDICSASTEFKPADSGYGDEVDFT